VEDMNTAEGEFKDYLNPNSLTVVKGFAEASLKEAKIEDRFQFMRQGYFCLDPDSAPGKIVFNRTTTLRDSK
jgi:glutaminyl-tRNA synthetase